MEYLHTKYDDLVKPYYEEMIKTLKEFVAIDSVHDEDSVSKENPFGVGVSKALNFMVDLARKDGFIATNYDNMVVEILVGKGNKNLTILAHADVVPEGKGWPHNPFTVTEKDGVLTGRGVADDKGPLLETYYALKALRDNNMLGNYLVRFVIGGNEERGSLGVEHYFHKLNKVQPDLGFSPDAHFPLIYAEKGIRNFKVTGKVNIPNVTSIVGGLASNSVIEECKVLLTRKDNDLADLFKKKTECDVLSTHEGGMLIIVRGKSAHGSTPQLGKNAAIIALNVINEYSPSEDAKHLLDCLSDVYGRGINAYYQSESMNNEETSMNLGIFNLVNGNLEAILNYRYVDTCNIEEATLKVKESLKPLDVEITSDAPLLYYDKECDLIKTLERCYREESGDYKTPLLAIGGGTYAKEADNVVAFGAEFPGWDSKMHSVGEGCKLVDMYKSMAIYARAIKELGENLVK